MVLNIASLLQKSYKENQPKTMVQVLLFLAGLPVHLVIYFIYLMKKKDQTLIAQLDGIRSELSKKHCTDQWHSEYADQLVRKRNFLQEDVSDKEIHKLSEKLAGNRLEEEISRCTEEYLTQNRVRKETYSVYFHSLLKRPEFLLYTFLPGALMYALLLLFSNPFLTYIAERLVQSVLVIVGVAVLVFTILYISPFDPASNILGESATKEQIAAFNQLHGLDLSYWQQLWNAVKGIATFDLGTSFAGNEDVATSIANKFPVTLTIALFSVIMAVVIAIPVGILSATRPNSFLDYSFMFIALIGLSIPNFWQGLIFILNFSIKFNWLPATYSPSNHLSMIMPVVVLGTALTASIARMMRSSLLEIIHEDYIITARAKGLTKIQMLWKHAVGNAMIPVITVIGLLFGGMLGGAAVTEKVFNIRGIGSYIVDKQFIPDIPAIMGGVVYIAITISIVNLLIDILYAFLDPRIRSKINQS